MSSYIGPLTNTIIEGISNEITKNDTQDKIYKSILNPVLCKINRRYMPYFIFFILLLLVIIILLTVIIVVLCKK